MTDTASMRASLPGHGDQDRRQYRLIYFLGYPVFLVATVLERIVFWRQNRSVGHGSIFEDARAAANNTIPFAFMGW